MAVNNVVAHLKSLDHHFTPESVADCKYIYKYSGEEEEGGGGRGVEDFSSKTDSTHKSTEVVRYGCLKDCKEMSV